ncbi:MAG: hypothetical protein WCA38_08740 [Candidatus Acidiferrales bacterium]
MTSLGVRLGNAVRQPSLVIALVLWLLTGVATLALCHGTMPLPIGPNPGKPIDTVIFSSIALLFLVLEIGLVALITRKRALPDLAARAPDRATALREILILWTYGAVVLLAGRVVGIHFFGEGIALHLNGSLVGATRIESPAEVYTWAAYNGILLAVIPYIVFRMRGYSNRQLNLRSDSFKSDVIVIAVVLGVGCFSDFALGASFFKLSHHQQVVAGLLAFVLHLFGTDLPVMIFIYSILMPRYAKLASPFSAFLLGAASYPAMHVFESWTRYDSIAHAMLSLLVVFLFFFPPGVMKSFLTWRTGNAWVHVWAFHAISPHVTVDTRLIVSDFNIG